MKIYKKIIGYFIAMNFIFSCKSDPMNFSLERKDESFEFISSDQNQQDFTSKRRFDNDSVFVDSGILCSDDTAKDCTIRFKITKNAWFVWSNGNWEMFFDGELKVLRYGSQNKTIKPSKEYKIDSDRLFGFTFLDEAATYSTDNNEYLFTPKMGIVAIKNVKSYLKRSDYKKDLSKLID